MTHEGPQLLPPFAGRFGRHAATPAQDHQSAYDDAPDRNRFRAGASS